MQRGRLTDRENQFPWWQKCLKSSSFLKRTNVPVSTPLPAICFFFKRRSKNATGMFLSLIHHHHQQPPRACDKNGWWWLWSCALLYVPLKQKYSVCYILEIALSFKVKYEMPILFTLQIHSFSRCWCWPNQTHILFSFYLRNVRYI